MSLMSTRRRRQPARSTPSRCDTRGGGWRRSSSSSSSALFLYGAATNEAYGWATFGKYLFDERIFVGRGTPCS